MKVKIINQSKHPIPQYKTSGSAGVDLHANLTESITLQSLERALISTGLFLEIPTGYEGQVRPRSGLAIKQGIGVLNSPGTIDSDYRGEVKVIIVNYSNRPVTIQDGERIAQLVFARHEVAEWEVVEEISMSDRGTGGFGHTGK